MADPRAWLDQFPAPRRGPIANWFHYAVRGGATTPTAVLQAVQATLQRRLQGRPDPHVLTVLEALQTDAAGALAYAQDVLAYEALPRAAQRQVKAERAVAFLMRGKPVTPAQVAYLMALGYREEPPVDRAAASALIDHLKQGRREA